jgi:hypothetical protein
MLRKIPAVAFDLFRLRAGRAVAQLLICAAALQCTEAGASVATAGSGGVGRTGAFTYQIPIRMPPGTAGVAPKLALSYNSQGGNGVAGVGWNLSGLSAIMRCPRTAATDNGVRGGVNLNTDDRLCLDGQRLILQSGSYGSQGAVYFTEEFNGSRIKQIGGSLTPYAQSRVTMSQGVLAFSPMPAGRVVAASTARIQSYTPPLPTNLLTLAPEFVVQTAAGETMEYVPTEIGVSGFPTRMWLLFRVIDVKGNYWVVDYDFDAAIGEYTPKALRYTGNDGLGLAPYNEVVFEYETRPDPSVAFVGGFKLSSTKRLKKIKTAVSAAAVTEYRLDYEPNVSASSGMSRLASVTECEAQSGSCLQPIRFQWSGATAGPFNGAGSGGWSGHSGSQTNNVVADFNGDGKADMAGYAEGSGNWHVCLSTGSGFDCGPSYWRGHSGGVKNNFVADFDGDGKADMAGFSSSVNTQYGSWHVCLSTGSGFNCNFWTGHNGGADNNVVGDFNGDGRADMAGYAGNGQWHVCLSTGSGFNCSYWAGHPGGQTNNVVADFNGDGMADIAAYAGDGRWQVCLSTGSGFNCSPYYWQGHWGGLTNNVVGDFNGDGKADIAGFASSVNAQYGSWHVCLSTGAGFDCSYWTGHNGGQSNNVLGDFNGDGRADMAGYAGNGQWHVCLSTGSGFNCSFWSGHGGGSTNNFPADYNGDGRTDLAGYTGSGGVWHVTLAEGVGDLLTGVTNSLGAVSTIQYELLTTTARYRREFGVSYPDMIVAAPLYVVTHLEADNGLGSRNALDYWYGTAVSRQDGRGFLGFNWQETLDQRSGIVSRTTYDVMVWPFTGMPTLVQSWTDSSKAALLSQSRSTPAAKTLTGAANPANTASCTDGATAGRPAITYAREARQAAWDIDAARSALPGTLTQIEDIDCLGNVKQMVVKNLDGAGNETGYWKRTVNQIENWIDGTRWLPNRLMLAQVTSAVPNAKPLGDPPAPPPPQPPPPPPPPPDAKTLAAVLQIIQMMLLDD